MKRRIVLTFVAILVVLAALVPLGRAAGLRAKPGAAQVVREQTGPSGPTQITEPIEDLSTLLEYPYPVHIEELVGPERDAALGELLAREETVALAGELAAKGLVLDLDPLTTDAEVMRVQVQDEYGLTTVVTATTVTSQTNDLSVALTAMVADDGTGFFQAHHTNLDPNLAEVPDPPIVVNGMPYFYITTLRWINGRIIYWRYWWYDSHHHPNWYYAHYYWYWWYYPWHAVDWPYWYWWVHGWYYWRYWYYWSTWFPFVRPAAPVTSEPLAVGGS